VKKRKYTKIHKKYIRLSSNYNNVINVFFDETTVVVDLIKLSVVAMMPRVLFAVAGCCSLPLGAQLARHTPALET